MRISTTSSTTPQDAASSAVAIRFSLLTLLGVLTVAAILGGMWSTARHKASQVHASIEYLREQGMDIYLSSESDGLTCRIGELLGTTTPAIESLFTRSCVLDSAIVEHVNSLPVVKAMSFTGASASSLNDHLFNKLHSRSELLSLDLSWAPLSDEGLQHLASLPQLKELSLRGIEVSDDGLAVLSELENLEGLDLRECIMLTDRCAQYLADLQELSSFRINAAEVTGDLMAALVARPLEVLEFSGTSLEDENPAPIERFSHLKRLDIASNRIADATLQRLGYLTDLEALNLAHTQVTANGVSFLTQLRNLRVLSLADTQISAAAVSPLSQINALESLTLARVPIVFDAAACEQIARLRLLTRLDLSGNKISSDGIAQFSRLKKLDTLYLAKAAITNFEISDFAALGQLKFLFIVESNLSAPEIARLMGVMPNCQVMSR